MTIDDLRLHLTLSDSRSVLQALSRYGRVKTIQEESKINGRRVYKRSFTQEDLDYVFNELLTSEHGNLVRHRAKWLVIKRLLDGGSDR